LKGHVFATVPMLLMLLTISITSNGAQSFLAYQAGAVGDLTTIGNLGVGVSIQTHAYNIDYPNVPIRTDAFWVGSDLADGGFIQFGYELVPGYGCLKGFQGLNGTSECQGASEQIRNGDPRWFWEYWPSSKVLVYYFQDGPSMSGGENGTWHNYRIADEANRSWSFTLDGVQVASLNVTPSLSTAPPYEFAEQVTTGNLGQLGPVEFRNLSYFRSGVWLPVEFLRLSKSCGVIGACSVPNPYNVTFLGENDILAGSLEPLPPTQVKSLLQTSTTYLFVAGVFSLIFFTLIAKYTEKRRRLASSHSN
jgi:hypothetical protein